VLRFCATWYCTADLDLSWDVRATGWHVLVEGNAPLDIDIRFPGGHKPGSGCAAGAAASRRSGRAGGTTGGAR